MAVPPVPSLIPDRDRYSPGDNIRLDFSGLANPAMQDWIGLYAIGAANEQYGEWSYLKAAAGGSLSFRAPPTPGTYEFRLFLNWPAGGYADVARSRPITVAAPLGR